MQDERDFAFSAGIPPPRSFFGWESTIYSARERAAGSSSRQVDSAAGGDSSCIAAA